MVDSDPANGVAADNNAETCPCGTLRAYGACCGLVHHKGAGLGVSAEQLMRARYSAYEKHDAAFLLASWHPDHRPEQVDFSTGVQWHGLEVVATTAGDVLDATGTVEFKARFERGGQRLELHELSRFERFESRWVYVDGIDPDLSA